MEIFFGGKSRSGRAVQSLRRTRRAAGCLFLTFFMALSSTVLAGDIDIYTNNGEGVEPNILIIFDNSGSMNEEIQVSFYDPSVTY
ncbi:MAG: hypothetical protein JRJ26_13735, partial [Deltaproteobacteria bacterium]|nr:hypothetical protein [Deltaproteobacteria bacterium]